MMRFLPCYQAVENLRRGMTPREAAEDAVGRMLRKFPAVSSGIVVVDTEGNHGGAGSGWTFTYALRGGDMNATQVVQVPALDIRRF
jgi:N4-(beta-N-acetylglucosaminyl)-L-asparaginase